MRIDFDKLETTVASNFRGGEKEVSMQSYSDNNNKIMRGKLIPGASIGPHTHETSSEIIYILSGTGKVLCDGAYEPVSVGTCHYCPKGHSHSLTNASDGDLVYFAVIPEHG